MIGKNPPNPLSPSYPALSDFCLASGRGALDNRGVECAGLSPKGWSLMSHPRWLLALLALPLCALSSRAQGVSSFNPHQSHGGISVSGSAGGHKGKASFQITVSSYSSRAYLPTPYL